MKKSKLLSIVFFFFIVYKIPADGLSASDMYVEFIDKPINVYAKKLLESEAKVDKMMTIGPDHEYYIEETELFYYITRDDYFFSSGSDIIYIPKKIIVIPKNDLSIKALAYGRAIIPYYSGLVSSSIYVTVFFDKTHVLKDGSVFLDNIPMILQRTVGNSDWTNGNIQTFELLLNSNMIEKKVINVESLEITIEEIKWR